MSDSKTSFMEGFAEKLGGIAARINSWRYIIVIKNAFAALVPVIMLGAFGTLLGTMVFGDTQGLAQYEALSFLALFKPIADAMSWVSLSFITIYVVFLMGIELAHINNVKGFFAGVVAVMSYLAVNPSTYQFTSDEAGTIDVSSVLASQYTDAKGLFLGMIVAIAAIELWCWLGRQEKLQIKMPDTVPPNVAASFSKLIPTIFTVTVMAIVGFAIKALTGMYAYDIVYSLVQQPLQGVTQGLPGFLVLMTVAQVFWLIGIHGVQIVMPIRDPLFLAAITANSAAFAAGTDAPYIINQSFWDVFACFGGSGCTIGLIVAIFIASKRADHREIAKLSLPCGIFNINEPLIFGLPIILNPIMAIPFIVTPLVTGSFAYFATALGFCGKCVVAVPWATPPVLSAWLATAGNINAVIVQVICIILSIVIFLPFVKVANRAKEA